MSITHRIRTIAALGERTTDVDAFLFREPAAARALLIADDGARVADALRLLCARLGFETEAHARRLAAWCRLVGARLGLDGDALDDLERGCFVHDVGKLAVPHAVLSSSRALDPTELDRIKMHSSFGHAIVFGVCGLRGAAEVVLAHHEYFDGTGYPRGLAGDAIPKTARIFAAVDSYEAMVRTDRPFRSGVDDEAARTEIAALAGRKYDAGVVRALLDVDRAEWDDVRARWPALRVPVRAA